MSSFDRIRRVIPSALPGATIRGWLIAAVGALVGISATGAITAASLGMDWRTPFLMIPLAASSVILYVLPASPLARPWAIIGGHTISALVGVATAHWVPNLIVASGLSVCLSIIAMAATRSLHPPGGSTALLGVLGGPLVAAAGYRYALMPVAVNASLLVVIGVFYHRWCSGHPYPHAAHADDSATENAGDVAILSEDIDTAVARLGETIDMERDDVESLVREVERAAADRRRRANPSSR